MNEEQRKQMQQMSGETDRAPRLELNELVFNGKKGTFALKLITKGLIQVGDKKTFEKVELGQNVKVVFLRIRRKLRAYRKGEKALTTIEHNTKFDRLVLFGDTVEIGTNDELREKFQLLKTTQVVYCLLIKEGGETELVRLNVKGSALGSQSKAKDVYDFYSYISSYKANGQDLHFYDYITELFAVEETSDMGEYYAMTFKMGSALPESSSVKVFEQMKKVHEFTQKYDEYYRSMTGQEIKEKVAKQEIEEIDTIEYPTDDSSVEDIPF
jgi:hypothetical protein